MPLYVTAFDPSMSIGIVFMALFVHWLLVHALVWVILWLEEKGKKLALLLALFEQRLLLHRLVWVIL